MKCFATEPPKHRLHHEFLSLSTQRAPNMPDDLLAQSNALFHCTVCSFITGPELPYYHEHKALKMCIGDAVLDTMRKGMVKSGCIKNGLIFSNLKDAPNPTEANCTICSKKIGFDLWNIICLQCDEMFCKTCVDAGRFAHRHSANWCRIVKKGVSELFLSGMDVDCDCCSKKYYRNSFTGLHCMTCNNHDYCFFPCVKGGKLPKEHTYCGGKLSSWELRLIAKRRLRIFSCVASIVALTATRS